MARRPSARKILFSIDLKNNGGRIDFCSTRDFVEWTIHERDRWKWIELVSNPQISHNLSIHILNHLESIFNYASSLDPSIAIDQAAIQRNIDNFYLGTPPSLYHSMSSIGQNILKIKETFGPNDAALAYALVINLQNFEIRNPSHFKLMSLVTNPATIDVAKHIETAQGVLREAYTTSESIHSEQRHLLADSKSQLRSRDRAAQDLARRAIRKFVWLNWKNRRRFEQTRQAYEQNMQLRAAVDYWKGKRDDHFDNRKAALEQVKWFAIIASTFTIVVFSVVSMLMLEASGIDVLDRVQIANDDARPAPAFFATMLALLGTVLTCVFWTARILVRNYLTERRMMGDAEERRVMTMTFLALVNEGAAKEEDRLVVLNALFRPASDTGGNDDGNVDIALPAIVAKLMDQRTTR